MKNNPKASGIPTLLQTSIQLLEAPQAAVQASITVLARVGLVVVELLSNYGRHYTS